MGVLIQVRVITGGGSSQQVSMSLDREGESRLVGSAADCDLRVPAPGVSPHHVRIINRGVAVELERLSADGRTMLDDREIVGTATVGNGNLVKIGTATLLLEVKPTAFQTSGSRAESSCVDHAPDSDQTREPVVRSQSRSSSGWWASSHPTTSDSETGDEDAASRVRDRIRDEFPQDYEDFDSLRRALKRGEKLAVQHGYAGKGIEQYMLVAYRAGLLGPPRPASRNADLIGSILHEAAKPHALRLQKASEFGVSGCPSSLQPRSDRRSATNGPSRRDTQDAEGGDLAAPTGTDPDLPPLGEGLQEPAPTPPEVDGFHIHGLLGEGGEATVWRATHIGLSAPRAIKVLKNVHSGARQKLRTEAIAASRIEHDNVVRVYDYKETPEGSCIVMDLIEGPNGKELLRRLQASGLSEAAANQEKRSTGDAAGVLGLTPSEMHPDLRDLGPSKDLYFLLVAWWFAGVADGLAAGHAKGVFHYDIKPSNLLLDQKGRLRLADFGMAAVGDIQLSFTSSKGGTPQYLPPERVAEWATHRGQPERGPRADIWSLGATLYEFLCGKPAYEGPAEKVLRDIVTLDPVSPGKRAWDRRIPSLLDEVCRVAMARDPEHRYADASLIAEQLRNFALQAKKKRRSLVPLK